MNQVKSNYRFWRWPKAFTVSDTREIAFHHFTITTKLVIFTTKSLKFTTKSLIFTTKGENITTKSMTLPQIIRT